MADRETLQARLDDAEAVLHKLNTGSQVEELRYAAGSAQRSARYTPADRDELRGYIRELRSQLGLRTGRRALGVVF